MSWVAICDVSQVQEEFPYSARVNDTEIGVFLVDDQYYAMEDVCLMPMPYSVKGLLRMAKWSAHFMRLYLISKQENAYVSQVVAISKPTRLALITTKSKLALLRSRNGTDTEFQPLLTC